MSGMKRVKVGRADIIHIETPLGIVNVHVKLTNSSGQRVERVDYIPNKYAGEPTVTMTDGQSVLLAVEDAAS